jgi:hypothetical protein
MNTKEIETFEKIHLQLEGIYDEVKALSNKRPDDAINLFKLRLINQLLVDSNKIIQEKNRPFKDFKVFDEASIPTNSDVVFVLSGYLSAFEKVRAENIDTDYDGEWHWISNGKETNIRTSPPKKLGK